MDIIWITITVHDFEKSKEFYQDYLGMKKESEFAVNETMSIAFFEADNGVKIELIYDSSVAGDTENNKGVSVGIRTSKYNDLLQRARGQHLITTEPAVLGGNVECFFVKDPDGVGIQIIKGE